MVGLCNRSSGISSKVECSDPWTMVDRVWWVGEELIDFEWKYGVSLHRDGDVGSVVLVV
jgi:hypothetical protein